MVTQIDPISTPPTPADPPEVFEERASLVWSDLFKAVPQMNSQAQEIGAIGQAAVAAGQSAQADSDAALGYRNEARAARDAAQGYQTGASGHSTAAGIARAGAESAAGDADAAAGRAEAAAAGAESTLANAVQRTAATGAAMLPEGDDAQRPGTGNIPAGSLIVRGNTQDSADYKGEFWDRVAAVWKSIADRTWVAQKIGEAVSGAVTAVENWVNLLIGYAMVYPNGGSSASPANAAINAMYDVENPFPGRAVICVVETFYNGQWGESGWAYDSATQAGNGISASHVSNGTNIDLVRVTTGNGNVTVYWAIGGGSGHAPGGLKTIPFRVKVYKVKGTL